MRGAPNSVYRFYRPGHISINSSSISASSPPFHYVFIYNSRTCQMSDTNDERSSSPVGEKIIAQQPTPQKEMDLTTSSSNDAAQTNKEDDNDDHSLSTIGSGYDRETNECQDFCLELFSCFGLLDDCCPSDGEGCFSNTASFCGTLCISMIKC